MKLLLKEIRDKYIQENFKRIQAEIKDLNSSDTTTVINNLIQNLESVEFAAKLIIERTAAEDIVEQDVLRLETSSSVVKANTDSYTNSKVIGVALNDGTTGQTVRILLFGVLEDASFSFPINEPLFLNSGGAIGDTAPSGSGNFITGIGQSLGSGSVFISIDDPIEIL